MIRIRQCKQDCCMVREPSKRFWYVGFVDCEKDTATNWRQAIVLADALRHTMPLEVTA